MRSLEEAKKWWPLLEKHTSLAELRNSVRNTQDQVPITVGLRSACWKAFLLFENLDRSTWPAKLLSSRDAYGALRTHFLRGIEHPDELESSIDPLSDYADSPWEILRKDEAVRQEIFQDVLRCMPENLYFRQPSTQTLLLDILFIWSRLNPDIGYRQGMHEVLAPILWVVERDAIDLTRPGKDGEQHIESAIAELFDSRFVGHDTFTLFGLVMQNAKSSYELGSQDQSARSLPPTINTEAPMVTRSKRVVDDYLMRVDPALAAHLHDIEIIPQVFMMRWVRLLFGREFPFDHVLYMWDRIFAHDPRLDCIDFICVAMLLRIRWQRKYYRAGFGGTALTLFVVKVIEADSNTALSILLRYPELPTRHSAPTLVDDALYLREHLDLDGGCYLIGKYSQKPPPLIDRIAATQISLRQPTGSGAGHASLPDRSSQHLRGGLEGILQDAAQGVYTRGEKWGVGRAVRDVVGEVRKNVQGLQLRTPTRPGLHTSTISTVHGPLQDSAMSAADLLQKIETLQLRNESLAKMLESAVDELWRHQKNSVTDDVLEGEMVKASTMAIAKVQLVQVYLEDSTLPLPSEEDFVEPRKNASSDTFTKPAIVSPTTNSNPADENDRAYVTTTERTIGLDYKRVVQIQKRDAPHKLSHSARGPRPEPNPSAGSGPSLVRAPTQRPPLAQSSFSWMLSHDPSATGIPTGHSITPRSAFLSESSFSMLNETSRARGDVGYLFGDSDDGGRARRGSAVKGKEKASIEADDEAFRLGTWKGRRKQ